MAHAWWRDVDYALFDRLTRERDDYRAALASCQRALDMETKHKAVLLQQAERERDEARALLRDIEWNGGLFEPHRGMVPCCPCCGRERVEGHTAVCRLDAALGGRDE